MLEHARAQLAHAQDVERRSHNHTEDLERRVSQLESDIAKSRDEEARLREEARRAKSIANEEARRSASAVRRCKDMQLELDSLRRQCDSYQARLTGVQSERDQALATVLALRTSALGTPSGLENGATVALLTSQLLATRQQKEELKATATAEHRRAETLAGKVAALELEQARSPLYEHYSSPHYDPDASAAAPRASPRSTERSSGAQGGGSRVSTTPRSATRSGGERTPLHQPRERREPHR